ncbi:hypothetical protein SERLA73DRAFT_176631 [Serpula lacrymans var. lacrymans S7.3]|uniref:Uncharacterized protein n=2 Tax=Serpula lacrymans var. lacrymans TaxID=341189 RepID=F8PND0_SERL3|nr:uncharacterized protein SERLADRAFT_459750 [Serpula lacrymans var. lacrymans S7.9]EGO03112.1 hypothetical protein SERLA73DRAFT_176631 [Serpula lacrymans var. lacrymans S7.3]EGO28879.1 hypothetical protein SERLADRAFT_459750 [Serpula lacrymans var. lacrymans S7.9]
MSRRRSNMLKAKVLTLGGALVVRPMPLTPAKTAGNAYESDGGQEGLSGEEMRGVESEEDELGDLNGLVGLEDIVVVASEETRGKRKGDRLSKPTLANPRPRRLYYRWTPDATSKRYALGPPEAQRSLYR